jgi:hypothetical protein
MPDFVPGIELCGRFYREAVGPILDADFPGLPHSAALIGAGSEVLGFDTEMSTDHNWAPRVHLFLRDEDHARHEGDVRETLSRRLPPVFLGYPTGTLPKDDGTRRPHVADQGPIESLVEVVTITGFFQACLDLDVRTEMRPADWLSLTGQDLLSVTAGAVYHDAVGLQAVRDRFAYYPRDVWLYLLASGWTRIGQEEHLMGRAGSVRDELGSALIASRLVRDLMRLCFLMERRYAPYPKWFGTAFSRLACAPGLTPDLRRAQSAQTWREREAALVRGYEAVARMHNALGITEPLTAEAGPFFGRPFRVIHLAGGFAGAIARRIQDAEVRRTASRALIGSIDQFSDSTDLLGHKSWRLALRSLYD